MNDIKLKYDDYYEGYFAFLDELKESGVTNMFGAVPYLMDEFILDKDEALDILSRWMESYK
tara:strand:+ start:3105 stop:3287 length:183 start_codon:yes stop_codon:yes gene_type:complete